MKTKLFTIVPDAPDRLGVASAACLTASRALFRAWMTPRALPGYLST